MIRILPSLPLNYIFRKFGRPGVLPMSLTLSVSYKCNSRCKTCNIYKKESDDLSLEEWQKIFQFYGKSIYWVTLSGGEPFLRGDLVQIICALYDYCKPAIINIPTNGLLTDRIPQAVNHIVHYCRNSQIVINVSLDGIKEDHDQIRGVPGCYTKAKETFDALKALGLTRLSVGIHTVISRFNVSRIPEIYQHLIKFAPDSYITEIAEERVELGTIGADITPGYREYTTAIDFLLDQMKTDRFSKTGKIAKAFRMEYYKMVKSYIKNPRQMIPCYSGVASAQIAPDGNVWMCCIKAESIGNLRECDYSFERLWFSEKAADMRNIIKEGGCCCPLANASYTNMLHDPRSMFKVIRNLMISYDD